MFLPAMRDFQAQATCRLAEAEDLFQDMKTRVRFRIICLRQFSIKKIIKCIILQRNSRILFYSYIIQLSFCSLTEP